MSSENQAKDVTVQEEFVKVQGVKTAVLKLGDFKNVPEGAKQVLILIIPGNPGIPHFYEDFMQELYSHWDGQVPVWTLGHAGHLRPPGSTLALSDIYATPENLYGLEAQITHKVAFIRENIPPNVSVILIGHSIGCYMILNMLDQLNGSQVLHCFLLFPTIERMAVSPSGVRLTPIFCYLRWLLIIISFCLCIIPRGVRKEIIRWWYKDLNSLSSVQGAVLETLGPWTVNFSIYMAKLEMSKVVSIQKDLIKKHSRKLSFYYGVNDHWAPVQYYYDLIKEFPDLDARLCTLNLKHAFILVTQEGREMAKIVWLWAESHHLTVLSKEGESVEVEA